LEELFRRLREGDPSAREQLFDLVYAELHRQARTLMALQRPGHTLQPTALVNEAYFKLCGHGDRVYTDRQHFLRVAAKAMGQVLIDHARRRAADKRSAPGGRVELEGLVAEFDERSGGLVALGAALERLEQRDPQLVRLVELRFFGGHEVPEAAEILGISERTAARLWKAARLFLRDEMSR
jgi:RNA polymerase sigma factor (TIGR02999 family)